MMIRQKAEKWILKIAEKALLPTTFDRLLLERRRRINKVAGYYPEAVFLSKGKSETKYCVVRYTLPTFALMAAGIQYVFCYHQLRERGYIPLIDIEYAYSFKQGKIGENNIWDLCFEQPITVKEAANEPYVLVTGDLLSYSDDPKVCQEINNDIRDHFIHVRKDNFREYYARAKKYIDPIWKVKPEIVTEFEKKVWDKVRGHRVLGVFLRENFTKDVCFDNQADKDVFVNHPLLPGVRETIEIIKTQLQGWKYEFIFLSTIYEDSLQIFREEFDDIVICIDRQRMKIKDKRPTSFGMSEKELYEISVERQEKNEEITKMYLEEIMALSRCNYLIGGASSGMAAALTLNGGEYEDIYILQDARKIKRY